MIDVRSVTTPADLRSFIDSPRELYRDDPYWVPPLRAAERDRLDRRANPFFEHAEAEFFLAYEHGRVRGRITAIDDHGHNTVHRENLAAFGLFEADGEEVARALLGAVEAWARRRNRIAIRGPLNLSLNESAGLLVDGFDSSPAVLMPYNPPSYAAYLANAGYEKVKDLYAWTLDLDRPLNRDLLALSERVKQRFGVRIGSPTSATLLTVIPEFLEIYSRAWKNNWGFVPPTPAESRRFARDLRWIADPEFVIFAEINGAKVACVVAVPDLNQILAGTQGRVGPRLLWRFLRRRGYVDRGRLFLLGVLPEYQHLGLYPLLVSELLQRAARSRYQQVECSWVLEDNVQINKAAARLGARRTKTYRLFQKSLE